eukprot:scaffold2957_cov134-Skeletonema_menzelii.AAC.3
MPSKKKKKKSKGRGKAAKKAEQQGTLALDDQMERLKIDHGSQTNADEDENALLEEAIKLATSEKEKMDAAAAEKEEQLAVCNHGHYVETEEEDKVIRMFNETFFSALTSHGSTDSNLGRCLRVANKAVVEKYPDVMNDPSKLKLVVSLLLYYATHHVLQGDCGEAWRLAPFAPYFDKLAEALKGGENVKPNTSIIIELYSCDEHTLVKYLRKHIPCSCLDEKYKEVKSIARTGLCFNCSAMAAERSKMLCCARCGEANYCSRECQKADWPNHKEFWTCGKPVYWNVDVVCSPEL